MIPGSTISDAIEQAMLPARCHVVFREAGAILEVSVASMTRRLLFPEIEVSRVDQPSGLADLIGRMRSALTQNA